MRILLATDAWLPQVNGVVRTLETTARELGRLGHEVRVVHPGLFANFPCTVYPEIHLGFPQRQQLDDMLRKFRPDTVHIATEGPVGFQMRGACVRRRRRFTTSYHTKFPEYLKTYLRLPLRLGHRLIRWFHSRAARVMVSTATLENELRARGFRNHIVRWSRGVDTELFRPRPRTFPASHRPIRMYVGRLAPEKNIEAFLRLPGPGVKYVVGDGPARVELQRQYPQAIFLGPLSGERLAEAYSNADVLVFPSRTDTFGLVILEALACGVPVAAYPVPGPADILGSPGTGALHENLETAVERALKTSDPAACVTLAQRYSWRKCTEQFLQNLARA